MYAIAEANLGRIRLASGDAAGALSAFETALALLEGAGDEEAEEDGEGEAEGTADHAKAKKESVLPSWKRARVGLQAQFGIGMAHFVLGQHDEALAAFERALSTLETAEEWKTMPELEVRAARAHVSILLARVLWTLGGQDREEAAKAQLLDSIADAPQNLGVIVSLAAAGAVTGDADLMDTALSAIINLGRVQVQALDGESHVDFLISMERFIAGRTKDGLVALRDSTRTKGLTTTKAQLALAEALLRIASLPSATESQQESGRQATERRALILVQERAAFESGEMLGSVARLLGVLYSIEAASSSIYSAAEEEGSSGVQKREAETGRSRAIEWAQRAVMASPWDETHWTALAQASW